MAQADSFPSVTAGKLFRIQSNLWGNFDDKVDLGQFYLHAHCDLSVPIFFHQGSILSISSIYSRRWIILANDSFVIKNTSLSSNVFTTTLLFLRFFDRASRCICVIKTNLMHYLSLLYFVHQPLHVSGIFVAHHQEVYCIYTTNWYVLCWNKLRINSA